MIYEFQKKDYIKNNSRIKAFLNRLFYFFINVFLLNLNIILFNEIQLSNQNINGHYSFLSIFRNVDKYTFSFLSKTNFFLSYKKLIFNKYTYNKFLRKKEKKKTIKLNIYGFDSITSSIKNIISSFVKQKFHIKFDNMKPDYIIYNVFEDDKLIKIFNSSIKIAFFTENFIPDLSTYDYAIGHAHLSYLDRYLKFPFCFVFKILHFEMNLSKIHEIRINSLSSLKKKKFCSAAISNSIITDKFRLLFIEKLNKYKQVDMGGSYNNNIGGKVKDKIKFFSQYKFSIAMENSDGDGYATEKIIDSFLSGTIPIYYGDYMIDEYINPKSFILIKGEKHLNEKLEYIKQIDSNDSLFINIMKEPIFLDKDVFNKIKRELKEFFLHIFERKKIYDQT
jgi:hypothetical protein